MLTNVIRDLVRTVTEADERAADTLRKLSAQATVPWLSDAAHSQYWALDNPALDNMGRVIAGKPTH